MFLLCILFASVSAQGHGLADPKVVYGRDNRMDVCDSNDQLFKQITRNSVAAVMNSFSLSVLDETYNQAILSSPSLGVRQHLCSGQRFVHQPTAAVCSSTLVAPDRVITAGHCVNDGNCHSKRFVFGYYLDNFNGSHCAIPTITRDDVYTCARVERIETDKIDWAIVHLDRPVVGRVPVLVERNRVALHARQNLTVIGFGSGIPAKIDRGGRVIDPRSNTLDYFTASTDTFGGSSGSGVFDDSGKMVGILVRGQRDYISSGAGCSVVNVQRCSDEYCTGLKDAEELTYVWRAMAGMPDCNTDTDCPSAKVCTRSCGAGDGSCTGWCAFSGFVLSESSTPVPSPSSVFMNSPEYPRGLVRQRNLIFAAVGFVGLVFVVCVVKRCVALMKCKRSATPRRRLVMLRSHKSVPVTVALPVEPTTTAIELSDSVILPRAAAVDVPESLVVTLRRGELSDSVNH